MGRRRQPGAQPSDARFDTSDLPVDTSDGPLDVSDGAAWTSRTDRLDTSRTDFARARPDDGAVLR